MTTEKEVQDKLRAWIIASIGGTVIFDHESGSRPALPYIMVNKIGSRPVRDNEQVMDYSSAYDPDEEPDTAGDYPPVTATPYIEREWRFSVHSFAAEKYDAATALRRLESAARIGQRLEPLSLVTGLTINRFGPINEIPEFVNNRWEPRANCDIFVRGITQDGFAIDVINAIPIEIDQSNRGT